MMADISARWSALKVQVVACIWEDMNCSHTENSAVPWTLQNETIAAHNVETCRRSLETLIVFAKAATSVYVVVAAGFLAMKRSTSLCLVLDTIAVLQNLVGKTSIGMWN